MRVDVDKIAYKAAQKKLKGDREVVVHLDGNCTKLIVNDKEIMCKTIITDNIVTIEKCRKIIKKLNNMNCFPKVISFDLSVYTETEGNECGDFPEKCLLNKKVYYTVDKDKLLIWKDGKPVYENNHGVICNDPVTLADCYC